MACRSTVLTLIQEYVLIQMQKGNRFGLIKYLFLCILKLGEDKRSKNDTYKNYRQKMGTSKWAILFMYCFKL